MPDVVPVDPSIPDDGSRDVSAELAAWLNDPARDGTTVMFPLYGLYRCDKPMQISGRQFTIFGRGCTIRRTMLGGQRGDRHLSFHGCDVTIRSLIVRGSAFPTSGYDRMLEAQHAFEALGCTRFELVNCRAYDVWGDKIYLGPDEHGAWTQDVNIVDFHGGISHRDNIAVTAARRVTILGGDFGETKRTCVDFEANGPDGGCIDFAAHQVRFGKHRLKFVAAASGWGGTYTNIRFDRCDCYGSNIASTITKANPAATYRNWEFAGCTGETDPGGSGAVFTFDGVDGVTLIDNRNPYYAPRTTFASFANCTNITDSGNSGR